MIRKAKKTAMESEILEQPKVIKNLIDKYKDAELNLPENVEKIILVASGSSYHCARFSADLLGNIAGIEARAIYSSEFNLKTVFPHDKNTLYVFITQSGETKDTVEALKRVNQGFVDKNCERYYLDTLAITNCEGSTIWKNSKYQINCYAGEENSIAATKSFTAEMFCVLMAALVLTKRKGQNINSYLDSLEKLPEVIESTLELRKQIKQIAGKLAHKKYIVVTADGISYSIAKETALKIKETSYKNVNAIYLGEFMHGHVAVLNNKSSLIYISVNNIANSAVENLQKIKKDYNPQLFVIGKHSKAIPFDYSISKDCDNDIHQMFSNVVIIQLIAFEIAKKLKRNIDKPKGLHKVVV